MNGQSVAWKLPLHQMAILAGAITALIISSYDALRFMVEQWSTSEEYGYAFFIPLLAIFFVWQKSDRLSEISFTGSWVGVLVLGMGIVLMLAGDLAALYVVVQYGFLLSLAGVVLAFTGWQAFRVLVAPLAVLLFMIPLPNFLYQSLSAELQLISSQIGVFVIRLFGISVYLEGNVIDLGTYKLQVVEACSGLRYLFPLTSLAFIAAYLFRGALWKKVIIFISSVPITVLMNSFRIGVIGVLVEYGGPEQAEGFLHDFEGWVVFMGCMGILILEMALLARLGKDALPFSDAFAIDLPEARRASGLEETPRFLPVSFKAAVVVAAMAAFIPQLLGARSEEIPERPLFTGFPMEIGKWRGAGDTLEQIYINQLKFDDYIIADYRSPEGQAVNFYVAYYGSQKKGESAHSPKSCIPGGGWGIVSHEQKEVSLGGKGVPPLSVNRLLIQKGEYRRLVYYWFHGRGRNITNEYMVKWYIFWDALNRNRTDGALVRLTANMAPGEEIGEAEARLADFARAVLNPLDKYVPD
ncbi:VPLPA-CTERM-specific exosortase XrtD [Pseudomonadota bacterium]